MKACQAAVSSAEFTEWRAFDRIWPVGQEGALLAHLLAAVASGLGAKRFNAEDAIPARLAEKAREGRPNWSAVEAFKQHLMMNFGPGKGRTDPA